MLWNWDAPSTKTVLCEWVPAAPFFHLVTRCVWRVGWMLWRKRQILLLMWEQIPPLSCSSSPEEPLQGHSTQVILQWKYTAFCVAGVSNIQVKVKATKRGTGEASPQFTNMIAALLGIRPSGDRLLSSFIGDRVCQWVSAKFITSILCGGFKLCPEEPTFKV